MAYVLWLLFLISFGWICGLLIKNPFGFIAAGVGGYFMGPPVLAYLQTIFGA